MLRVEQKNKFPNQLAKFKKRGKDPEKLYSIVRKLPNGEPLAEKHRNHYLESRKCWKYRARLDLAL